MCAETLRQNKTIFNRPLAFAVRSVGTRIRSKVMRNRSSPLNPVDWYRVPTGLLLPDNLVMFASSLLSTYKLKVS